MVSMFTFADNTVEVKTGAKELKAAYSDNAVAALVIDWSDTKYDHEKTIKEFWGEKYDFFIKECEAKFKTGFDEKSKGLKLDKSGEPKYKITLKVTNLDRYVNVMNIVPGFTVKVWGMVIVAAADGTEIARIDIDSMKGNRDFSLDDAFGKAFYILGKRVASAK